MAKNHYTLIAHSEFNVFPGRKSGLKINEWPYGLPRYYFNKDFAAALKNALSILKPGNHTIGITNTPYRCTAYAAKQALKLVKQNHQLIGQKIPLYIGRSIYKSLEDVMEDVLQAKEKFPNHDMTIGVTHRVTIAAIAKVLAEEENTDPSAIPHLQQVGAANNRNKGFTISNISPHKSTGNISYFDDKVIVPVTQSLHS